MYIKNVSEWLRLIVLIGVLANCKAAWLRCYKGTINNYLAVPLEKPLPIITQSCIDLSLPTVFYTFGYRGKSAGPATTAVLEALILTRKRNVLLLDWEEEARSSFLGIPLGYALFAVPNAVKMGINLGDALAKLASAGLNTTNVHLVGHSLGAHLMGYAGRSAREKGYIVPRITGLDPARALFEGSLAVRTGLDRTCARFVDIVHSDPGGYGTSVPAGTVDIWPNYVGVGTMQPGCPIGEFEMFSGEDLCSHDRAWKYFVEAIASPTSYPAVQANNFDSWLARTTVNSRVVFLGLLTNTRAQGNFFLTTKNTLPYGKGMEGIKPEINTIRRKRTNNSISRFLKYLR